MCRKISKLFWKDEKWKRIQNFPDYFVSYSGKIASTKHRKTRILRQKRHPKGYLYVGLYKNNKQHAAKVHRIVAEAFIPNALNKPQVNHRDGNKSRNIASNLEWVTQKQNIAHNISLNGISAYCSMLGKRGSKSPFSIRIKQFSITGKFLAEYIGIRQLARKRRWNHQNIILNLKNKTRSAYGFIWKYS